MNLKNRFGAIGTAMALAMAAGSASAQCSNYTVTTGTGSLEPTVAFVGGQCDDCMTTVALPFSVNLYGNIYTSANVSSNGTVQFATSSTAYYNECATEDPAVQFPGPTMLVHWDDMWMSLGGYGIHTAVTGAPGSQVFSIEWRGEYYDNEVFVTFGVRLYENSSRVDYIYGSVPEMGQQATVGIQDGAGNNNIFSCDQAMLSDGMMITFQCPAPTQPLATGRATPNKFFQGGTTLLSVTATAAQIPPSTGMTVRGDLSSIGGSGTQTFYDDGSHGDVTAGDNIFSFATTVANPGQYTIPFTLTDAQSRTATGSFGMNVLSVTSLGTLNGGPELMTSSIDLSAGEVRWFTFTVPAVDDFSRRYLDIHSYTSADSEVGIYSADGNLVASDDDDGDGAGSALSFGVDIPTRPAIGNSAIFDSRDGDLAAGTYYMAVSTFNTTFNPNNFNVTSTGPGTFGMTVGLHMDSANNPYLTNATANGAVGGNVLLAIQASPGQDPVSTGMSVKGDLSAIGGSSAQTFYDDGSHGDVTAGDGMYSYLAAIPHAPTQTPGAYNLPMTVSDSLSRTGSGAIVLTLTAEATGSCCTGGNCAIATAFNCSAGGGTYNGDGSNCDGAVTTLGSSTDFFPLAIPGPITSGVTPGSVTSTLTMPSGSGTVNNLAVVVGLEHSYMGDVRMSISNGVNTVDLVYRPNVTDQANQTGYAANYGGTYVFADSAGGDIWAVGAANLDTNYVIPSGNYFPSSMNSGSLSNPSLAVFNGAPLDGTWTLTVEDWWAIDTGNVTSFSLASVAPVSCGPTCGTSDYNGDGDFGTDSDIEAFFACLAGTCCPTCFVGGSDFNGDGDFGTDADIESFFRVLAGNPC